MNATLLLWFWIVLTTGHFVRVSRVLFRLRPEADIDTRTFNTVLLGTASLSGVLHGLILTIGVSMTGAAAGLALFHGALTYVERRSSARHHDPSVRRPFSRAEFIAAAAAAGVILAWVDFASLSDAIVGTDAAHYHGPAAINIALGATWLDLPATPHLYPIGGSVMAAWFLLPTGTPLLIDLSMCLPWLVVVTALNVLFRLATGLSGLAWASWLSMLLFATPIFRISSLLSADLWFAAGFLGLVAALLPPLLAERWRPLDVVLASLAAGLLVGSKATGWLAGTLVLGCCVAPSVVRRVTQGRPWPRVRAGRALTYVVILSTAVLASGGIWLVRNWSLFGSPFAPNGVAVFGLTLIPGEPFQSTTYLSVLGDMERTPGYALWGRTQHFIRLWLNGSYLVLLLPALTVPIDMVIATRRGASRAHMTVRFVLLAALLASGGLCWVLIGAPWTSLEWTRGLALRYILPVLALGPLVALVGLFPLSWRWYDTHAHRESALLAFGLVASVVFFTSLQPGQARSSPVPPLTWLWLAVGALVPLAHHLIRNRSTRDRAVATVGLLALGGTVWSPLLSERAETARQLARATEERERVLFADGVGPAAAPRALYLAARSDEVATHKVCAGRRFFALTRVDEPLLLQDADFQSRVFYAGRDQDLARPYGPLGPCDYVITTPAVSGTDKGSALVATLFSNAPAREVSRAESLVLLVRR